MKVSQTHKVCKFELGTTSWHQDQQKAYNPSDPIKVDIKKDFVVNDGWMSGSIEFEKYSFPVPGSDLRMWDGYQIPPIQVTWFKSCYKTRGYSM